MGVTGPVPKRSEELIRRNKPETPIDKIQAYGEVKPPTLRIKQPRGIVRDLYEGFKNSAQAKYYEPSDWEMIRLTLQLLDNELKAKKANGQIIAVIMSTLGDLLATEGSRRRVRMEIDRSESSAGAEVVDIAAVLRDRQMGSR